VFGEHADLGLPALTGREERQVREVLACPGFDAWSAALARVGNCAQPIRLRGRSETVDTTTGEVVAAYNSEQEPLGVTQVRCGNRRASVCPSCSRLYAADMFHLIRAGVTGGKRDGPRLGRGQPAGVRHAHRTLVRDRARPPLPTARR